MMKQATAWLTTRFLASEADVLEERELQNGCAMRVSVNKRVEHNPSFQKKRVPLHRASRLTWIDIILRSSICT